MSQARTRGISKLPHGYHVHQSIDLKNERKFKRAIQVVYLLVVFAAIAAALIFELPLTSGWSSWATIAVTVVAIFVYMAVHEATHGVAIHVLTGIRPFYGINLPFLTTGSRAYLNRRSFVIAALAPCVLWGIVLLTALLLLPADYRLTAYILLALNFAGSAGDFVLVAHVRRQQPDILVQDDGSKIRIFGPQPQTPGQPLESVAPSDE